MPRNPDRETPAASDGRTAPGPSLDASTRHESPGPDRTRTQRLGRVRKWLRRGGLTVAGVVLAFGLVIVIGLLPVNNDFQPTPNGIEIAIVSNAVHADFILPIQAAGFDWRQRFPAECFAGPTQAATHVAIGWGDKGFFILTPTWSDLKLTTATHALLWPSDTCLHVTMQNAPGRLRGEAARVRISPAQYRRLVAFIESTFVARDDPHRRPIEAAAYGHDDAFFEAVGRYHALNTCNSWVGRGLRRAGVRTAWYSPMPKSMCWYLPDPATDP